MDYFASNKYLQQLLAVCGVEHEGTFESMLAATQRQWLIAHPHLQEEGATYPLHQQTRINELVEKLGYVNEIFPVKRFYDYAIILGGETPTMEPRFGYLQKLWQQGIRFGSLIFHSGIHAMPDYDFHKNYTEAEALRSLYKNAGLAERFPAIPHIFVDIPLQETATGVRNPTTADGVKHWLSANPQPGSCLVISSQPYVHYQHAVFCSYMPSSFTIETVGSRCAPTIFISDILDSITRHLYQENQRA